MSLIEISRQFDDMTLALLRAQIGRELLSYEGYALQDGENHIYKTARVHFDDHAIDLINEHETLALGPEFTEEQVALLRATSACGELWTPKGKKTTCIECGFFVSDVLVVVDSAILSKGSRKLIDFKWVQAVMFENEDGGYLAFDRDIWTDEYISVRHGASVSATTRDFRPDWIAEPPHSYEFGRVVHRLSSANM